MAGSVFTRSMNLHFCQIYNRPPWKWGNLYPGAKDKVLVMSVKLVKNEIGVPPLSLIKTRWL
jgi:hypothetical protein